MNKLTTYIEAVASNKVKDLEGYNELRVFEKVNPEEYQQYIPVLCKYIQTEKDRVARRTAYDALAVILLPDPGKEVIDFLMDRLAAGFDFDSDIMSVLSELNIPHDTDLDTLKDVVRFGLRESRELAFKAFSRIDNAESEHFLLEVLSRTDSEKDIFDICEAIKKIGTIRCFPILLARLSPISHLVDKAIYDTLKEVSVKLKMSPEECEELIDPLFWKTKWTGTAMQFVEFMAAMPIDDVNFDERDGLAEIYIREMEVDISPYKNFKELRICYSKGDLQEITKDKLLKMLEQLESIILMDEVLEETGVSQNEETYSEDLLAELRSIYMTTRLRRYIKFEDDDY